jgi:hypothetical protein
MARLVTVPDLADVTGAYFDMGERQRPARRARDDDTADRLWSASADLVGVDPDWP